HMALAEEEAQVAAAPTPPADEDESEWQPADPGVSNSETEPDISLDPIAHLARAAGYADSERWWERLVEHRRAGGDVFAAVLEAMTVLRTGASAGGIQPSPQGTPEREARREAYMRQTIRAAQQEGFERIAVVCGAWHAPALAQMPPAKDD